eukprot:CAMPEP_0198722372 /NCGR_PEP_ID=MMETSP1475-20131203/118_1 /TAXON_ID= ORGANISM="Unidentified sp., Strain CCMP1999" /NCGR_SAMPLE_ID=MMETSP1475 /ASSEMBLY_ACC=CAM_ASM_001111 /LENGTH=370 /DNA_ID=CAMNT_0044483277 /DNA_START=167 /DNA_END=1279 /DNA_ORIENTATION=-
MARPMMAKVLCAALLSLSCLAVAEGFCIREEELTISDVETCSNDPLYNETWIQGPDCRAEVYDFAEGAAVIQQSLDKVMACDTTRNAAEADQYWKCSLFDTAIRRHTCKRLNSGVWQMVIYSSAARDLFNVVNYYCMNGASPYREATIEYNVLQCNPERTLPNLAPPGTSRALQPLDKPASSLVDVSELTHDQKQERYDFNSMVIIEANEHARKLHTTAARYSQLAAAAHTGTARQEYRAYARDSARRAKKYERRAATHTRDREALVRAHSNFSFEEQGRPKALADLKKLFSQRQTLQCVDPATNMQCDDHVWYSPVLVNSGCTAVCMSIYCSGIEAKLCLEETVLTGFTLETCHADSMTRGACFDWIGL